MIKNLKFPLSSFFFSLQKMARRKQIGVLHPNWCFWISTMSEWIYKNLGSILFSNCPCWDWNWVMVSINGMCALSCLLRLFNKVFIGLLLHQYFTYVILIYILFIIIFNELSLLIYRVINYNSSYWPNLHLTEWFIFRIQRHILVRPWVWLICFIPLDT